MERKQNKNKIKTKLKIMIICGKKARDIVDMLETVKKQYAQLLEHTTEMETELKKRLTKLEEMNYNYYPDQPITASTVTAKVKPRIKATKSLTKKEKNAPVGEIPHKTNKKR